MNPFLKAAKDLINRHGTNCAYTVVTEGVYDEQTLSTTNTAVSHAVKMFKNHIKTSQYSYPNLIGKEIAEFYLANDSIGFVPNVRDLITINAILYTVEQVQEHHAVGSVALYTIIASRS